MFLSVLGADCNAGSGTLDQCEAHDDCLSYCQANDCAGREVEFYRCSVETAEEGQDGGDCTCACADTGSGGSGGAAGTGGSGGTAGSGGAAGSGGTAGSGGGPCSSPLPMPSGGNSFFVDVYATFEGDSPGAISFADDGRLFVANVGVIGVPSPEQNLPILRIDAAATEVAEIGIVSDPDVLVVDNGGLVAMTGNVLVGGLLEMRVEGRLVGRLTELDDESGATINTAESDPDPCIFNVSAMLFAQDNSLLLGNFVLPADATDDNVPAVCKVTKDTGLGWVLAETFIMPLNQPVSGLTQAPRANNEDGDLFLSRTVQLAAPEVPRPRIDEVDRYDSTGTLESGSLTEGIVLGYGPVGSEFDGVLILRSSGNLDLVNPVSSLGSTLLTGVEDDVGNSAAFYPNGSDAVLYISQWEQRRILRVSKTLPGATDIGCPAN